MRTFFLLSALLFTGYTNLFCQEPLRVLVVFAHPDEGELYTGGIAALYTRAGHAVKFMSLTNGDAGHYEMKPVPLAARRYKEAMESKRILSLSEYEVLGYHDQHLANTKQVQDKVIKSIQDWNADIVFTYYPAKGGHTDNMTAGYIVRDAATRLQMKKTPVFVYVRDYHTINFSYIPDFAISIDSVMEIKLAALAAHKTQVSESIPKSLGILEEVRSNPEKQREVLYNNAYPYSSVTDKNRFALEKWYGKTEAAKIKYAESYEIAEFGRQVDEKEMKILFPVPGN